MESNLLFVGVGRMKEGLASGTLVRHIDARTLMKVKERQIFRDFFIFVAYFCISWALLLYIGDVTWYSYSYYKSPMSVPTTNELELDVAMASRSLSIPVQKQKDALDEPTQNNPYGLTPAQITAQFETALVPSLKARVKRFACWHSCFGPFRRKLFRKSYPLPFVVSPTSKPVTELTSPATVTGNDTNTSAVDAAPRNNNELGDGEDAEFLIMPEKGENTRVKKASGFVNFSKLKTKVVQTRETSKIISSSTTTEAPRVISSSTTTKPKYPPLKRQTFSSYVQKKRPAKPPPSKGPAVVAVKVQVKSESVESKEEDDQKSREKRGDEGESESDESEEDADDDSSESEEESDENAGKKGGSKKNN